MDLLTRLGITVGGYVAAAAFLWLYIDAKSDIKAEIERCNVEKMAAVADARRVVRYAEIEALREQISELEQIALQETMARHIAEEAATAALTRPERVRTIIKEVASANACIDTAIPDAVLDGLRD